MSLNALAILLAALGASAELFGLVMIVREIAGDRERARGLLEKDRQWRPERRSSPRRVLPSSVEARSRFGIGSLQPADIRQHSARQVTDLINAHNQLAHDVGKSLDDRTTALFEAIDTGDKELRDVLRELLRGSIIERYVGVAAIGAGILLSMAASILSTIG